MLFRQKVMGVAARGARFNSTNAYVSKASSLANSLTSKVTAQVKGITYWSKVTAELAKQVYLKEGFAPPSGAQFKQVFNELNVQGKKMFKRYTENPNEILQCVKAIGKQDVYKYGAYTIQVLGMFTVGEVIGRRHIVDYKKH